MVEKRPNRVLGPGHDDFWSYCAHDELRIQRCQTCGHLSWPPVERACEMCGGTNLVWDKLSGRGKVISWCTFYQPYYPDVDLPYDAVLVELDEGPLLISNPDGFANEELTANTPVAVSFIECTDDAGPFQLPVFKRV